jgi:hypothetical protein
MSIRVPVRFTPEASLVFPVGERFDLLVLELSFTYADEALEAARKQWPNLADPIEVTNMGAPKGHPDPRCSQHFSRKNYLRLTHSGQDVPLLFVYRWHTEFTQVGNGGTTEVWGDYPLTFDLTNMVTEGAKDRPLALIQSQDYTSLKSQLRTMRRARDEASNTSVEALGRVINP